MTMSNMIGVYRTPHGEYAEVYVPPCGGPDASGRRPYLGEDGVRWLRDDHIVAVEMRPLPPLSEDLT